MTDRVEKSKNSSSIPSEKRSGFKNQIARTVNLLYHFIYKDSAPNGAMDTHKAYM